MKRAIAMALCLFLAAATASATDGVLIPVFFGGPGAFGATWRTRVNLFNHSDSEVPAIPILYPCGIPEGCFRPLPPRSAYSFTAVDGTKYGTGFFLYTGKEVSCSTRVYDISRSDVNYGTEIPVVPMDSFSSNALQLLDVPADGAARATLRLYAVPPAAPQVRVRIFRDAPIDSGLPIPPPSLLRETMYDLQLPQFGPATGSFSRPSGLVIGDLLAGITSDRPVRVEVQSDGGAPVWAMATVTNNRSQVVTVIAPRN